MSGYGYNYDNTEQQQQQQQQQQGEYDGYQQQFQYGYQGPYSNEYGDSDQPGGEYGYDEEGHGHAGLVSSNEGNVLPGHGEDSVEHGDHGSSVSDAVDDKIDFDDPRVANLPRILLMGPRRAGKTSIQRVVFHKMSPHETLFRLEATQNLERSVVDHTPLCRFTIWDFPGDYYGPESSNGIPGDDINVNINMSNHINMNTHINTHMNINNAMPMTRQPPVHGQPSSSTLESDDMMNTNPNTVMNNGNGFPNTIATGTSNNSQHDSAQDYGDAQVFGRATALIFVLDAQDEPYDHVLQHFTETVKRAARANPHIAIEVFINKVDGELFLSDEAKYDCRRDVMQQVSDELADAGVMPDSVQISYHLTSIYDHSVFEAFSRVVQKLIPQLPTLENLLNVLVSTCAMEKAYLFDVASKLYISTDSSPVDMQSVELCSDMIDVVLDVSGIYGLSGEGGGEDGGEKGKLGEGDGMDLTLPEESLTSADVIASKNTKNTDGSDGNALPLGGDDHTQNSNSGTPIDYIINGNDELVGTLISQGISALVENEDIEKEEGDSAYDSESASVIRLSKGMVLYMKEVDTMLALVCLTRSDNFRKRNLINYNIRCLKKALRALTSPNPQTSACE